VTYLLDVEAMQEAPRAENLLIENHLWIEFSQSLRSEQQRESTWFNETPEQEGKRQRWKHIRVDREIAALFYYSPALEDKHLRSSLPPSGFPGFRLDLIAQNGHLYDRFLCSPHREDWGLVQGCEECTPNEDAQDKNPSQALPVIACQRCGYYLSAWRNRFCRCLTLIERNDYRPGLIPAR
jgi:hypothetical protein